MVAVEKNVAAASGIPGLLNRPRFWAIIPIAISVTVWAAAPYFWLGAIASTTDCAAIAGVTGTDTAATDTVDNDAVATFRRGVALLAAFGLGCSAASAVASGSGAASATSVAGSGAASGSGAVGSGGGASTAASIWASAVDSCACCVSETGAIGSITGAIGASGGAGAAAEGKLMGANVSVAAGMSTTTTEGGTSTVGADTVVVSNAARVMTGSASGGGATGVTSIVTAA